MILALVMALLLVTVHTDHHHLAIIAVLAPRLCTCIHHRRSVYVA
jgi:hypothetical protein